MKYLKWLFWKVVYLFRPVPKTLNAYLIRGMRCWSPWKRFKPYVWHNDAGQFWDIWFEDDCSYTERRTLEVDVMISDTTGDIIGLQVPDYLLSQKVHMNNKT